MVKKKIVFVVNPHSGTRAKRRVVQLIRKGIDTEKYGYEIVYTQRAGHAVELSQRAVTEGADMVVAVGGDGTVNEVGRSLCHTQTALGIIPCGSGNGLARHLMIPLEPQLAIDVVNEGVVQAMDYGKINDIPFFCTCGVGFDALVSKTFAEAGKRGIATYVESALHEFLNYKPDVYELTVGNGSAHYKAFLITCANASQYGNNAFIAPQASLSDGLMDVTILQPFTVLDIPKLAFQLFTKTIDQNSLIKTIKCREIDIVRSKGGAIHFDGDPITTGNHLHIELVPKGIPMVVNTHSKAATPLDYLQFFNELLNSPAVRQAKLHIKEANDRISAQ